MNPTTPLLLLLLPVAVAAQTLAPEGRRIDDRTIQADHATYEATQGRIRALNDGGRRVADYHLAKAQCWLDASFHEYTRNDRSAFPQAALAQSGRLLMAMEGGVSPLPMDTPLVNDADRLRPDLWSRFEALKSGAPGPFRCAAQKAACGEVFLAHAGNEHKQQGWRHAKPYVQMAEDAIVEAETAARACGPEPVVAAAAVPSAAAPPTPTPAPPATVPGERRLALVFAFDRSGRADIRERGVERLDRLLAELRREGGSIVAVRLTGHADVRNGTGDRAYNQRLSERRAETVRALLVERGVAARVVTADAAGDRSPREACAAAERRRPGADGDCFTVDRRVDAVITTAR